MPTYQYQCTACRENLEVVQKFTDDSLTECPKCEGRLKKIFSAVGVVFKGSGFYRTDSRDASSGSTGGSSKTEKAGKNDAGGSSGSESKSGGTDSGTKDSGSTGKSAGKDGGSAGAAKPAASATTS